MIYYLLQSNIVDFAIVIFLYIFIITGTSLSKRQNMILLTVTIIVNILIFADATDYYCASLDKPLMLRYITSATGYALRPAAILGMIFMAQYWSKKIGMIMYIPFLINAVFSYLSIYNHWMFYFDEANQFHRGVLGILPFAVCGLYLVLIFVVSIKKFRMGNKMEGGMVVLIVLMLSFSSFLETAFGFKFIINGIGGISVVFYYVFLHTQTFKRDALTGALNRHSFYSEARRMSKRNMAVISIDLNNLKEINDNEGHSAGDKAIYTVAECIFKRLERNCMLFRMGGDEFAILYQKADKAGVERMMNHAAEDIKKKGYCIAWGYAMYEPGMDFEKVMSISDKNMYENKIMIKKMNGQCATVR